MAWLRWHKIHLILHISQYLHKMEKYSNCFSHKNTFCNLEKYTWLRWHKIHPILHISQYLYKIGNYSNFFTARKFKMGKSKSILWQSDNACLTSIIWLSKNRECFYNDIVVVIFGFGKMSNHVVRPLWSRVHQYWMIPELPGLFDHKLSHSQKSPLAFPCSAKSDQNLWIIFPLSKPD